MNTLVFLDQFNNYFNRKIIIKNSLEEYLAGRNSETFNNINFNPNDSVNTEIVINWNQTWFPDYLLVLDQNNNLVSRWFVLESTRTRNGQYSIELKRDTVSDFKNEILNAPTFIEKATVPSDSPLIFNSEGMSFNQIKKDEILLKDKTNMAWIVGYCVQDQQRHPETGYWKGSSEIRTLIGGNNIPTWIKNSFGQTKKFATRPDQELPLSAKFQMRTRDSLFGVHTYELLELNDAFNSNSSYNIEGKAQGYDGWQTIIYINFTYNIFDANQMGTEIGKSIASLFDSFDKMSQAYRISLLSNLRTDLGIDNYSNYRLLTQYNGIIYRDGDRYYKIHVDTRDSGTSKRNYYCTETLPALSYFKIGAGINSNAAGADGTYTLIDNTTSGNKFVEMGTSYTNVYIWREEVYSGQTEVQQAFTRAEIQVYMPQARNQVLEQPYDMFCIPYGELQCNNWVTNKDVGLLAARTIAKAGVGAANAYVYDVQLLPFCPIQDLYIGNGINESLLTKDVDYTYITDQYNNNLSIAFWCRSSDFTFDIATTLEIDRNADNTYAEDLKISSECDVYRLCSPNYDGVFEFNLAKNDGYIDFFNVDCTYKPFNPYIHITPNFHGLYGQDFDDIRGLVCGGDFSIAMLTDQWAQYELQNKNYQQIFNTKIGTLDAFADVARNNLYIDTINDVFNNNAAATFRGATSGGLPGAIVAAAQTTVNSGVGLAKGLYNINESNRIIKNQLTNNFMYQLGNVKALPAALSKTSSFTRNNKIFPFIEKYSSTDEEKEMLKLKMKYDGMTVMRVGKLSSYIRNEPTFMRGQIIRLEGISDDTHIYNDIYNEIKKGVYL